MRAHLYASMIGVMLFFQITHLELWADELKTRDGKTLRGAVKLLDGNMVQVGEARMPLDNIQSLELNRPESPPAEVKKNTDELWAVRHAGALSWNGTFIASPVTAMDDTKVSFDGNPKELFLSTPNTSAVFFRPISLQQAYQLRGRRPGLLLQSGDFMEGELLGILDGRIKMESVLFGRKSYEITEAVALWLQTPRPMARPQFTIETNSGSIILTDKLSLQAGAVLLDGSPFRNHRLAQNEIVTVKHGVVTGLLAQAWAMVDNAPPEKKVMLLATGENVQRITQLRKQVQINDASLQEAIKLLTEADAAKTASSVERQRVFLERKQLQDDWRHKNREYWKSRSNKSSIASKARTKQMAVARAERDLGNSQRNWDKYTRGLELFEKDLAKGNIRPKDKRDEQRKRDAYLRPIKRAQKSLNKAQQQLEAARREDKKTQAESKPLPEQEKVAKEALDKAKKEIDRSMQTYRKTIVDYQLAIRQVSIARKRISELQQSKDQAVRELEELRPKAPAVPSNK